MLETRHSRNATENTCFSWTTCFQIHVPVVCRPSVIVQKQANVRFRRLLVHLLWFVILFACYDLLRCVTLCYVMLRMKSIMTINIACVVMIFAWEIVTPSVAKPLQSWRGQFIRSSFILRWVPRFGLHVQLDHTRMHIIMHAQNIAWSRHERFRIWTTTCK